MKKLTFTLLGLSMLAASCSNNQVSQNPEQRFVDSVVSKMTLQEKIGQLYQVSYTSKDDAIGMAKAGKIGSIINVVDPQAINEIQKAAVESSCGVPLIIGRDVIHGYKTIFPIPLGQAATFDTAIVRGGCHVAATEATSDGIRWTFSPMVDISQDPRWGRIAESYGEDPFLSSVMGAAAVRGYQGDKMNDPTSIAACTKHFAAYGASETGRDYNATFVPERELRNVYLPSFKAAVEAGSATMMSSFNDNDGVPSSGNTHILTEILRGEWGFDGFVVSDWNSIVDMANQGFCANGKEAGLIAIKAGTDMEMVSTCYIDNIEALIKEGKISEQLINERVKNVVRIKYRLGLFQNPYVETAQSVKYADAHLALAQKTAEESAILLKNNGILPLKSKKILLTGPMCDAPHDQLGTWIFDGEKSHTVTPLTALKDAGFDVVYIPTLEFSRDKNTASFAKAVAAAKSADAIVFIGGEESILSGEAHCLADINLKGAQNQLIEQLSKTGKPLVTVIMAGRPLTIGKQVDESGAVLYMFHPGTMGGPALANLLSGKAVPSGRTPATFPKSVGQIPAHYYINNTGRPYNGSEILMDDCEREAGQTSLGCTSFHMDLGFGPLFPFGYGLSYTEFEYSNLNISTPELGKADTLKISFTIKNTGDYDGVDVPQLYIRDLAGSITRPIKELKEFARVEIKKGESKNIIMKLPISRLAFCGLDYKTAVEPGDFKLWIAHDSELKNALESSFAVK